MSDEALRAEAIRVYERYATEVVEAFDFCPWAQRARREGQTETRVALHADETLALGEALEVVADVVPRTHLEVVLLVFPRLMLDARAFSAFVARLRELDTPRYEGAPPLVFAAFHPDAEARFGSPYQLVPFLRRSPDPTIQIVRHSVLAALKKPGEGGTDFLDLSTTSVEEFLARKRKKPLHERVAEMNLERVRSEGVSAVETVLRSILDDRDASYGALGVAPRGLRV